MANHCIDVTCIKCGAGWCCRGCGTNFGPDDKSLKEFMKRHQEWADKFNKGKLSWTFVDDERCPHCKDGGKVVIG